MVSKKYLAHELKRMRFDSNDGIQSRVWGPPMWFALHSVAAGFPVNATIEQQKHFLSFFKALGNVLPCGACRTSYASFTSCRGKASLNMRVVRNRRSISKWLYTLHSLVNKRLNVPNQPTFTEVRRKYESYRAADCKSTHGCVGRSGKRKRAKILIVE
jgi:hypothetical protein